jgi:hypothetical protein
MQDKGPIQQEAREKKEYGDAEVQSSKDRGEQIAVE